MMSVVFLVLAAYFATAAVLLKLGVTKPSKLRGHSPLDMVLLAGGSGLMAAEMAGVVGTVFPFGIVLILAGGLLDIRAYKSK